MSIQIKSKQTGGTMAKEPKKTAEPTGELANFLKAVEKNAPNVVTAASKITPIERIPTGMFEFDYATGGGFPKGRYSIVYGPESSGKTNLVLQAIAKAQRLPPPCNIAAFVDVENTFDPKWAAEYGIDVEKLILIKPQYGEQAVDIVTALLEVDQIAFVGYDSIATTISSREVDASTEKADVGTAAILIKRLVNKVTLVLSKEAARGHYPAVVFINQIRMKIGVMFGDPETQPGGKALQFGSSLTVRIYGKNEMVKEISSEVPVFKKTTAVIKKAKVGILQSNFEYSSCVLAHDVLKIGDSASWSMVESHLKALGLLFKAAGGKGWEYDGEVYPTLKKISMRYYTELDFRLKIQNKIVMASAANAKMVGGDVGEQTLEEVEHITKTYEDEL